MLVLAIAATLACTSIGCCRFCGKQAEEAKQEAKVDGYSAATERTKPAKEPKVKEEQEEKQKSEPREKE